MAGSTVDREIKITASDTGVFDRLSKLKEGALAMGRGIAEDAKKQATNSRELIRLMNDEIALIEKRNKLNKEARELQAKQSYGGDKDKLKSELQKISIETKEDKLQADLLKQILQAILKTSQEQISVNREGVKQKIESDKAIDSMEDHEQALKAMITKQMIQDTEPLEGETQDQARSRTFQGMGNFIRETDMYTMGFTGSSQFLKSRAAGVENKLAKRALLAGGLALGGLGMTISSTTDRMEGEGDLFRATGSYQGYGRVGDMTTAQTSKRASEVNLAYGDRMKDQEMVRLLRYERSQGINSEQLASISRYGGSRGGVDNEASMVFGFIKDVMKDQGMNQAKTNELLQASLTLQEQEYLATGQASGMNNVAILNRIMSGQGVADARRASSTLGRVGQVIEGGNDQLEAIKFSEFQRQHGGGYLDYLEEKEKGVSGKVGQVLINKILESNMDEEDKILSMMHTGLTFSDSKTIMKAGGIDPLITESVREGGEENWSSGIIQQRDSALEGGLNEITQSAAWVTDKFADVGEGAVNLADTLISSAQKISSFFSFFLTSPSPSSNSIHTHSHGR